MGIKIKRNFKKPKNRNPRWLGNLKGKLGPRKNVVHFLTSNNDLLNRELNQIQKHSNPAIRAECARVRTEVERQKCIGLMYANFARFR